MTGSDVVLDAVPLQAVVVGASAGGIDALRLIVPRIGANCPVPIIIVLHMAADWPSLLSHSFQSRTRLRVKEADEKETAVAGTIYFAPPGYHLLIEKDHSFSLSVESPVWHSRPSIDVLFESAADAYGSALLGVLLTGANEDGARGLLRIKQAGGQVMIQDPTTAVARAMPVAGIAWVSPPRVFSLTEIADLLAGLATPGRTGTAPVAKQEGGPLR